jgi:aspartyl-tRNA(Asn)/glutamyl-tRNA(Gln) amidotransferase subunit A
MAQTLGRGKAASQTSLRKTPAKANSTGLPQTALETCALLRSGAITCVELAEQTLALAAEVQDRLKCFITLTSDVAIQEARQRDSELRRGYHRGPLHGIPIAHKDIFDTAGVLTTMGSRSFATRIPELDADVVAQVRRAGTIMVGKTSMNECAVGLSGRNTFYGDVGNGHDGRRIAGGSSSGTAVAIAAGVCATATGTDTGGSIRAPAAYNGIVGLRTTKRLVSLRGVYERAHSFDVAGPLGRTVADVALMLAVMAQKPTRHYLDSCMYSNATLRIGLVSATGYDELEEAVGTNMNNALKALSRSGADVSEVRLDVAMDEMVDVSRVILCRDFYRAMNKQNGFQADLCDSDVLSDLAAGSRIADSEYHDALRFRRAFSERLNRQFQTIDVLASPTMPTVAPLPGEERLACDRARRFLFPASLAGLPAISVPSGRGNNGLPTAIQFIGASLSENLLLDAASRVEAVIDQEA